MLVEPPLTGERTYVHGVDILEALLAGTGAESDIVLVLRTAGGAAIETLDAAPAAGEPGCGEFRYRRAGCAHRVWLRHRPDRPITARRPWDDAELLRGATLGDGRASQPTGGPAGPLHRAVAMGLALLERSHPDDYWSIAEIACARRPPPDGAVAITAAPRLGWRFCRFDVALDGDRLGHVLMARGQPRRSPGDGTTPRRPLESENPSGSRTQE
ncbi:hypothetical protein STAQ_06270 [Allostella sp. ATCC 35155]|nr:hypothetical protein STAQ_06270 [Stella sp. ATCC 35155]